MAHLGDELKEFRKRKGMDQKQMAGYLGIGHRTYQSIEVTGIVKKISDLNKIQLKTALNTHLSARPETQKIDKSDTLLEVLIELMKTQNSILKVQKENVEDKVKTIDANLSRALGGVEQLSLHVESARVVILESLSRLEKKPGSLKAEADRIVVRLMKERSKHYNVPADGR